MCTNELLLSIPILTTNRADASIVGRKLKNLKKRAKKQEGRRFSESENSEGEVSDIWIAINYVAMGYQ